MDKKWNDDTYVQKYYKTKPCRSFDCHKDFSCPFYHGWVDRRREKETYFTKGCRHAYENNFWKDPSACLEKDGCHHAHSRVEMQYHSYKYKTQLCRDFAKGPDRCHHGCFCAFQHRKEYSDSPQSDGSPPGPVAGPSTPKAPTPKAPVIRTSKVVFGSQSYARITALGTSANPRPSPLARATPNQILAPALAPKPAPTPETPTPTPTTTDEDLYGEGACGPLPEIHHNGPTKTSWPTGSKSSKSPVEEYEEFIRNSRSDSSTSDGGELPMASFSNGNAPGCSRQFHDTRLEILQRTADGESFRASEASLHFPPSRRQCGASFPENYETGRALFGPYSHVEVQNGHDESPNYPSYLPPPPPQASFVPTPSPEKKNSRLPMWLKMRGRQLDAWLMIESVIVYNEVQPPDTMEGCDFLGNEAENGGLHNEQNGANDTENPRNPNENPEPRRAEDQNGMHYPRTNGNHQPSHHGYGRFGV